MQTLKSCEITDLYKHVCFKDLQDYIRKDQLYETLKGLCDTELDKIKAVLGVTSVYVEKVLREYSPNAIANGTVTAALREKANIDDLHPVAFSGNYKDLKETPCELPNPHGLALDLDGDGSTAGTTVYTGHTDVRINLQEWLANNVSKYIPEVQPECDCPIKSISVNNVEQSIDDCGNVNIVVPIDLSNYYDKTQVDNRIADLQAQIDSLSARVSRLEQGEGVNP